MSEQEKTRERKKNSIIRREVNHFLADLEAALKRKIREETAQALTAATVAYAKDRLFTVTELLWKTLPPEIFFELDQPIGIVKAARAVALNLIPVAMKVLELEQVTEVQVDDEVFSQLQQITAKRVEEDDEIKRLMLLLSSQDNTE